MEFVSLSIVLVVMLFLVLCYIAAPYIVWAVTLVLLLGIIQELAHLTVPTIVSAWLGLTLFLVVFGFPFIRQRVISQFIFALIKELLPTMSATEREAIDAGEVWWEGELFRGRPHWQDLLKLPKPRLTEEEGYFLNHSVEHLCSMLDEWTITKKDFDLPPAVWDFLKKEKFFGMIIPKKYGGLEFSALAHSTIVQKIATRSLTAAITAMVPNSLGPAELLINYGTEAQKQYYLPRLATGEEIPCFALTSETAGSDASAIKDIGIICEEEWEGKKIIGIKLTWNKRYITLAPVATVLGLAVKLYDPNRLIGSKESLGITLCLIPTHHPGVEIGLRHLPLHQAFMNGPTQGKEVFVPLDWVIGGPKMIGKGWHMLMERLSVGRGISLPALSAAGGKLCYRTTGAYVQIRKQFHTPIGRFEGVQAAMAKIAGHTYMIEATRLLTLTALDKQVRPAIITAMTKYHLTEMSRIVVQNAMDIHGGRAIMRGPNNYLGFCYDSLPISITVEGANILTRSLIIFGQGAIRCHPYIQQEMKAIQNPDPKKGIQLLDTVLFKHIQYLLANTARAIVHSFTGGFLCCAPRVTLFKSYYRQLGRMSVALAWISDFALILLGGKLKRCERLSARLGDVLSYLYMGSAVLKYYQDFGNKKDDVAYVHWCLKTCLYQIQCAFLDFFTNFPIPLLGKIFQILIFPYGRPYCAPSDLLEHRLVSIMMTPSSFRDRITQNCYLSKINNNPVTQLEIALTQLVAATGALAKLEIAIKKGLIAKNLDINLRIEKALSDKILTEEEAALLRAADEASEKAIQVDAFSKEYVMGQ